MTETNEPSNESGKAKYGAHAKASAGKTESPGKCAFCRRKIGPNQKFQYLGDPDQPLALRCTKHPYSHIGVRQDLCFDKIAHAYDRGLYALIHAQWHPQAVHAMLIATVTDVKIGAQDLLWLALPTRRAGRASGQERSAAFIRERVSALHGWVRLMEPDIRAFGQVSTDFPFEEYVRLWSSLRRKFDALNLERVAPITT